MPSPPVPAIPADSGAMIGLDWGTSALRAFLIDGAGQVLAQRQAPWGIMNLPPAAQRQAQDDSPDAAFERALDGLCADWLRATPGIALLACGMVGSAQGWREAKYLESPASLDDLAQALTLVERRAGAPLHIVAGLIQRSRLPNVMRGEETQVLGVLASAAAADPGQTLIGLPGTHSKWVLASRRTIEQFHSFMTGEVFGALCRHSILGKTMQTAAAPDDEAFMRGLHVAQSAEASLGLLAHIFSTRSLGLTGALAASAQADYLSGLLIGHEMAGLAQQYPGAAAPDRVLLSGAPDLCRRYAIALPAYGLPHPTIAEQASAQGLWQIANAAGLLARQAKGQPTPKQTISTA